MNLLFGRRGGNISMFKAVARNQSGYELMTLVELLLERGDDIPTIEEVVKAAVGNRAYGYRLMTVLLDRRADNTLITQEVVKTAAGNWQYGNKLMTRLFDRRGDDR